MVARNNAQQWLSSHTINSKEIRLWLKQGHRMTTVALTSQTHTRGYGKIPNFKGVAKGLAGGLCTYKYIRRKGYIIIIWNMEKITSLIYDYTYISSTSFLFVHRYRYRKITIKYQSNLISEILSKTNIIKIARNRSNKKRTEIMPIIHERIQKRMWNRKTSLVFKLLIERVDK